MSNESIYTDVCIDQTRVSSLPRFLEVIDALQGEIKSHTANEGIDNSYIEEFILLKVKEEVNRIGDSLVRDKDYIPLSVRIENIDKRVYEVTHPKRIEYSPRKMLYRGESNYSRKALPTIYRYNDCEEYELRWEDYYYKQIKVMCPEVFAGKTHLEHLVRMQHYGCNTRLLDITANPLVALFFACQGNKEKDGVVYIFAPRSNEIKAFDSDKVLNLACLPSFSIHDKESIYEQSIYKLSGNKNFSDNKGADVIERLYHEIRTEKPAYQKKLDPLDLLVPLFVQPERDNRRIEKQDGAFIITGLSKTSAEMADVIRKMTWKAIVIPWNIKSKILNELYSAGINRASLFPEIESVSEFLKEEVIKESFNSLPLSEKDRLKNSEKMKKYSFI